MRLLVFGAGGHGRVVAELLQDAGHELAGFIDRSADLLVGGDDPRTIIDEKLFWGEVAGGRLPVDADFVIPAIGDNETRIRVGNALGAFCAPGVVHPRAVVSRTARIEAGTVVLAGACINASARVGRCAIVNTGAIIEHDCVIGDGAHISPGAVLAGGVTVASRAWIGANATLIPGVRIGDRTIVGAGAVVLRDVANDEVVVGNPARSIVQASPSLRSEGD
jgi:sugar O-acyltransferase (sialic acid O-acetyltransferase NeuD family)